LLTVAAGTVFEKRLIEAYITENGTDPVTGEDLSTDDLIALRSARVVKPRPPTLTSIPSLLSVFQNEWDALTLESYTLKQHLSQLRQELSTALYNNDAAVRVIARLTKERNEARDALSKVSMNERRMGATNGNATGTGDAMQVDVPALPKAILEKVVALQEQCEISSFYTCARKADHNLGYPKHDVKGQCLKAGPTWKPYNQ